MDVPVILLISLYLQPAEGAKVVPICLGNWTECRGFGGLVRPLRSQLANGGEENYQGRNII